MPLAKGVFSWPMIWGLGKTIQGISWGNVLLSNKLAKKLMVICPSSLKYQWQREWYKTTGTEPVIVDGHPSQRKEIYRLHKKVFILNYELVLRDLDLLREMNLDAIILDEAQRIKNFATQTARNVKQLTPPFRLILTGTPFENRLMELTSLLDWIDSNAMGPYWRLNSEISHHKIDSEGEKVTGVRNLDLIRKRIFPHFLRRTREKILDQLPKRVDSPVVLPITESQLDVHSELKHEVAMLMKKAEGRPLTPKEHLRLMALLTQMRIVSNGMALYNYDDQWSELKLTSAVKYLSKIDSPKLEEFRNIIISLLEQKGVKIVIFSQWVRMLILAHWAIQDQLGDETEAVFFTGRQSKKQRVENICRFHDDPDVRIFFATDAGGVGINLQKAANICINLDLPWNPAVMEQRIARIHRLGQGHPVQIYNLITENSIESRIFNLIEQKRQVFKGLFDSPTNEIIFDKSKSFFSQIKKIVGDVDDKIEDSVKEPILEETVWDDNDLDESFEEKSQSEIPQIPVELPASIPKPPPSSDLFAGIHVDRNQEGEVVIRAKGDSATMLAGIFKNLGSLLEKATVLPPEQKGAGGSDYVEKSSFLH